MLVSGIIIYNLLPEIYDKIVLYFLEKSGLSVKIILCTKNIF